MRGYLAERARTGPAAGPGPPNRSPRPPRPIYGWFTEGFETRDLKGAKALLEELG